MPLNRYSRMDVTGDVRLISNIFLPKFFCKHAFRDFQLEISRLFGGKNILDNDIMRLTMYNRITLYKSALIASTYEPENEQIKKWYSETFGGEIIDTERLRNEIDRLEHRYLELKRKESGAKLLFEEVIGRVEMLLGYAINRKITIFEFKFLYDNAIKKSKR